MKTPSVDHDDHSLLLLPAPSPEESPDGVEGGEDALPRPEDPEEREEPRRSAAERPVKSERLPTPGQLSQLIASTLPLGIYPLKVTPFECNLPGGAFRAVHLKVEVPPEKQEAFDHWLVGFEERYRVRIHPRREWANDGIDRFLRRVSGPRKLLKRPDLPLLEERLERFHRLPPGGRPESLLPPFELGVDLTDLPFVTIDPPTTLDREDAIAARREPDGAITLWVSFIDVTWYVKRGGSLDRHLSGRAYSVYGREAAFPLLGREFSFGVGSFIPNERRLAWTFEFTIEPNGEIRDRRFYRAVIETRRKCTVEEVADILHDDEGEEIETLKTLAEASNRLWRRRTKSGEFVVIEAGEGKAERIVSECMITANIEAAIMVDRAGRHAIYTTYAFPSERQKEELVRRMGRFGVDAAPKDFDRPEDFSRLWDALRQRKAYGLLSEMLDRFFPRSLFGSLPNRHEGIPARAYLRLKGNTYVGIVNQWILEAMADDEPPPFSLEELERIGAKQNRQMRSYDSVSFQVRFIEMLHRTLKRSGERFSGKVVEVKDEAIVLFHLEDESFKKWGFIPLSEFRGYVERTGMEWRRPPSTGDTVRVALVGFDRVRSRFRFSLRRWTPREEAPLPLTPPSEDGVL